jgi:hypothetical protein
MDTASARAKKSYGPFNERDWVLRPMAFKEIRDAKGAIKTCAPAIGVPVSTFRNWFDSRPDRQSYPNWIPKKLSLAIDKYLVDLRPVSQGGAADGRD